ncbi:MAG: S-layer homology domain-containing protein [Acidimicrobiia bacterium]|nr:S-layer homology domain-containing protein [Acidimicrobiia bacterium]
MRRRSVRRSVAPLSALALLLSLLALGGVAPVPAGATVVEVLVTNDADSGPGSFRAAIATASSADDPVLITFEEPFEIEVGAEIAYNNDAPLTIDGSGSTLDGQEDGRILYVSNTELTVMNLTFVNGLSNAAGGALVHDTNFQDGLLTVIDSIFTNNRGAGNLGGAIFARDVEVLRSTFVDNSSFRSGGAIFASSFFVADSYFENNRADGADALLGRGGALFSASDGRFEVTNSTFVGNTAADHGGAIAGAGPVEVTNSTFVGNTAEKNSGGALWRDGGSFELTYVTLVDNEANLGAHLAPTSGLVSTGSVFGDYEGLNGCNLGSAATASTYNWATDGTCGFEGPTNVVDGDDPGLGDLGDNGGVTPTMLPDEDSPLVDAVEDCVEDVNTDQRGVERPQGPACDIGAVEREVPPLVCEPFIDVSIDNPFCRDIEWAADNNVATGWPDGTYRPLVAQSRQAMAAFLWRLADSPDPEPGFPTFPDVPESNPFHAAISWLAQEGVVTGFEDGTFRPADPISRQAMAAFFWRFDGEPEPAPGFPTFSDVPETSQFFTAISWMAQEEITTGFPDGTFRPTNDTSRQAMAAFVRRFAGDILD